MLFCSCVNVLFFFTLHIIVDRCRFWEGILIFSFQEDAVVDIGVEHGTEDSYYC